MPANQQKKSAPKVKKVVTSAPKKKVKAEKPAVKPVAKAEKPVAKPVAKPVVKAEKPVVKVEEVVKEVVKEVVPVEKTGAPTPVEEVSDTPYMDEFSGIMTELDAALAAVRTLKTRLQKLEKRVHKDHKANLKKIKGKKRRAPNPNAEPTGFQKPGPISVELTKFLGLKKGELISRTAVTQRINAYCKENHLQNPEDKRKIVPDTPLKNLLKMTKTDDLTFFNLQKYMKVHYPNKEGVFPVA